MILIADSGSTKTDWILIDLKSGRRTYFEGIGLNPYHSNSNSINKEVLQLFKSIDTLKVSHIYFYGAGCSTKSTKQVIIDGLMNLFSNSKIEVYHDLEGAARSLCKNTEGIACILGTGSNATHFDGKKIIDSAVSLGYLLGDEGSGNAMGKKLIHSIYLKTAPDLIIQDFEKTFNLTLEKLLIEIYQKPYPNRFLASFTKYINQNKNNPFILELIHKTFEEFTQLVILPLNPDKKLTVHFTGSIAWFFKDELEFIINKSGFILGRITQKPIDDLAEYHLLNI
ncbi:MAG: ATPase [Bacteroidales bacterium]|nr:ATPase [Bacteroidales bacterium]